MFLHGLMMDETLWTDVVAELSTSYRCIVPLLPLGAHRHPLSTASGGSGRPVQTPSAADRFMLEQDFDSGLGLAFGAGRFSSESSGADFRARVRFPRVALQSGGDSEPSK